MCVRVAFSLRCSLLSISVYAIFLFTISRGRGKLHLYSVQYKPVVPVCFWDVLYVRKKKYFKELKKNSPVE